MKKKCYVTFRMTPREWFYEEIPFAAKKRHSYISKFYSKDGGEIYTVVNVITLYSQKEAQRIAEGLRKIGYEPIIEF